MPSMTEYYGRMKGGIASINPADMAQLGEDWMVAAATGAGVGIMAAATGGLDKKVAGFNVPLDGLVAAGLGLAGLQVSGDGGKILKLASIAAMGSASTRIFQKFFAAGFKAKGEFEDLQSGLGGGRFHTAPYANPYMMGPGVGFGVSAQDQLVEAAKYL